MNELRLTISDAAKQLEVEPHVLRYWEEELSIQIPRNNMGHRYYSPREMKLLNNVKELKIQGFQLRTIRYLLCNQSLYGTVDIKRLVEQKDEIEAYLLKPEYQFPVNPPMEPKELISQDKMAQFHQVMNEIIGQALEANNKKIVDQVTDEVTTKVIKEMNYLAREQEERDEIHYKKIDEMLRNKQKNHKETAAALEPTAKSGLLSHIKKGLSH